MAEVTVEQLVEFTRALGQLNASQVRLEAAIAEASRRMEQTDKVVSGHASALQDGVREEIRAIDRKIDEYMSVGHKAACPFLQHQQAQQEQVVEIKKVRERRRWNIRDAVTIGIIMAVFSAVIGMGMRGIQKQLERVIEASTAVPVPVVQPGMPAMPAMPATPAIPASPATPAVPARPATPATPATPGVPDAPVLRFGP